MTATPTESTSTTSNTQPQTTDPGFSTTHPAGGTPTTASDNFTSIGAAIGTKIAYYASAKAAGITESAKMDALASELCNKVESDHTATGLKAIGPWLRDTYGLTGDPAALVAVTAIKFQCPQYAKLVGG